MCQAPTTCVCWGSQNAPFKDSLIQGLEKLQCMSATSDTLGPKEILQIFTFFLLVFGAPFSPCISGTTQIRQHLSQDRGVS
jgi:hypothetical protein